MFEAIVSSFIVSLTCYNLLQHQLHLNLNCFNLNQHLLILFS